MNISESDIPGASLSGKPANENYWPRFDATRSQVLSANEALCIARIGSHLTSQLQITMISATPLTKKNVFYKFICSNKPILIKHKTVETLYIDNILFYLFY